VETQYSAKIKKLISDNGGEYINTEMTTFLDTKGIIHELSPPYIHESNGLPEHMNCTIVTMVRSMTLNSADMIPQALWAEACSMAIHIKKCLPHSAFKLKKSLYKRIFGDKSLIKQLYPFRGKSYVYLPEEKQILISKLSLRGIKCYVVGYIESSKIVRLYDPQKC
jgi:hypothetical protein